MKGQAIPRHQDIAEVDEGCKLSWRVKTSRVGQIPSELRRDPPIYLNLCRTSEEKNRVPQLAGDLFPEGDEPFRGPSLQGPTRASTRINPYDRPLLQEPVSL